MSSEGDFGPLLEVLVTCVGVVDVVTLLAYIFDRSYHKSIPPTASRDENNNVISAAVKNPPPSKPQKSVTTCEIPQVIVDGISHDGVIDSLLSKVNELETKVAELEIRSRENSMERLLEVERVRRSRSPTPYSRAQHSEESSSSDERYRRSKSPSPHQKLLFNRKSIEGGESSSFEDESNTTQSESQSRESSFKRHSKPITRDDEFRKTKRSSQNPHESREDELAALTRIEQEENENLSGFVPIVYEGHEDDVIKSSSRQPPVSPIQEVEVNDDEPTTNAETSSSPIDIPSLIDVNENFIKMEQSKSFLVKQAHVSEDEDVNDIPPTPTIDADTNKNDICVLPAIDKNVSE